MRFIFYLITLWFLVTNVIAGPPYPNVQVAVYGLQSIEEGLVLSNLSIKAAEKEQKINEARIINLHHLAPQEITCALEALGYYHSKVYSDIKRIPGGFQVKYRIVTQQPTLINSVSVELQGEGSVHPGLKALAEYPPLMVGNVIRHCDYEEYKQTLINQALHCGFLSAAFERKEIKVNKKTHTAEVILVLNTGPQYRLGDVSFKNPPYDVEFLERYISFQPGAAYTTEALTDFQNNLKETELFSYVRINPQLEQVQDHIVPIKVHLKQRPTNRYFGSLGFGTDTGARGMLGFERRRKQFPGHKISTTIRGSKWFNQFNLRYTIPGKYPATDRLVFGFRMTEEKSRDKKYSQRGDLSITKIKNFGEVESVLDLNYLSEIYRELPGTPKSHSHFLIPSLGLVWTHVTDTCPKQLGFRLGATVRGGLQPLLSSTSFSQAEIRMKWIAPLGESARLLVRGDFGATSARNFDEIPLSLRFFAGGDQTVRGFGYKNLGPREMDRFGNLINVGGRYLAVGSIELEHKLYKKLSVATFVDTGNAMNNWGARLSTGGGIGLRYDTPLGPLRVDLARPLLKGKQEFRVHLTFGMDL